MNREAWLTKTATDFIWPLILAHGGKQPEKWAVSVGFGATRPMKTLGECFYPRPRSEKDIVQVFISPRSEAFEALDTLTHELVHAAVGPGVGHKGAFVRLAKAIGLKAPWKSAGADTALAEEIKSVWLRRLPPYPHVALHVNGKEHKPQTTRLVKAECGGCGYVIRVTRKWIDEAGLPICPTCEEPFEEA